MKTILSQLSEIFSSAIETLFHEQLDPLITQATQARFGQYQCNAAMSLAKQLKKNPREVALKLVDTIQHEMIGKLEVAGPGFINIFLKENFLDEYAQKMLLSEKFGMDLPGHKEKVIVEFSSPNVAKELHVGHLRSTIIGDCIARVLEYLDYDVLRLNHIGDWGTQFGMLIAYIKKHHPKFLEESKESTLGDLMQMYRAAKVEFDHDEAFKKDAQLHVVQLQAKEKQAYAIWQKICEISRRGYEEIYRLLDIRLKERGESFYNSLLPEVVQELESKGLVEVSNGAKCVFMEGFVGSDGNPLPMIIQKSDGGYNYATTDVAAFKHRLETEKAKRIVIVTDGGQKLHMSMVSQAARLMGYLTDQVFDHVTFGVVLGPDGKKFKTREGHTEKLMDLLQGAVDKAQAILEQRYPEMEKKELHHMAEVLGIDAVKYADLSCHRQKDYVFSYDKMLRFEGNTAAFLLYSYVRIQSIKRKVQVNVDEIIKKDKIQVEHESELALCVQLVQFFEMLDSFQKELLPNRICDYAFRLAEHFNAFFRDCRVEGDPKMHSRLLLCELTERVLKACFDLLGLKTLNKM